MLITRISQQVKNPDRANVFVDGKYEFSLDLNQVLSTKIKVGLEIDEADLKRLKKISDDGKLKIRTLDWLTLRPHSEKELKDYLKRKKVDKEQINAWAKDFQKKGYQNNQKFAIWWAEQRLNKQKSTRFIRQELLLKGIDRETIDYVLNDENSEKKSLKQLIAKKRKLAKYQDDKKLIEYLLRQGFNYSLIREVLAEE